MTSIRPVALLLGCTCLGAVEAAFRGSAARRQDQQPLSASTLLAKATESVGGVGSVDGIETLAISARLIYPPPTQGVNPNRFVLAPPNRFQWDVGSIVHTLSGSRFWQSRSNPSAIVERARENVRRQYLRMSIVFLLGRGPAPPLQLSSPGRRVIEGVSGDVLRFSGPDGFEVDLLLSIDTGTPILMDEGSSSLNNPAVGAGQTWRLEEYRPEQGIWFPHRIHQQIGPYRQTLEIDSVVVNSGIDSRVFEAP